jgi:hypothetical protein
MSYITKKITSIRLEEKMAKKATRECELVEQKTIGLTESNFVGGFCEDLIQMIRRDDDYIRELLKQLRDYEEELYQKDLTILQLESKALHTKYEQMEMINNDD